MQNGGGLLHFAGVPEYNDDSDDSVPVSSGRSFASYVADREDSSSNSAPIGHLVSSSVHLPMPAMYVNRSFNDLSTSVASPSTIPDLENRPSGVSRERSKRSHFTRDQMEMLESFFTRYRYPDYRQRDELARIMETDEKRVQVWFKNRRSKLHKETGSAIAPPKNILRRKCRSPLTMEMASPLAVVQAEAQFDTPARSAVQEHMVTSASGSPVQVDEAASLPLHSQEGVIVMQDKGRDYFLKYQVSEVEKATDALHNVDQNTPVSSDADELFQICTLGTVLFSIPYPQQCAPVHSAFPVQEERSYPNVHLRAENYGKIVQGQLVENSGLETIGSLVQESLALADGYMRSSHSHSCS